MGTWGVAIFSDDLAADLRSEFRELIGAGLTSAAATDRLVAEYASSLEDANEMPVFWIALAMTQWKLGRLDKRTQHIALQLIDDGSDLARWDNSKDRAKRAAVLLKTRKELLSAPPPARRLTATIRQSNDWQPGELIGFRLLSGNWTLFRVIGQHTDEGGSFAVCEILDWVEDHLPSPEKISGLARRPVRSLNNISQFVFQQPRKKNEQARVVRLGCASAPQQSPGGYTVLPWPHVDRQLEAIFELR
ncbi:MAG: hypothetical protein ACKO3T_10180 [Planctomycetaceae bacterium]